MDQFERVRRSLERIRAGYFGVPFRDAVNGCYADYLLSNTRVQQTPRLARYTRVVDGVPARRQANLA